MEGAWFCMGFGVETKFVVAHNKINRQWEGQGSMEHDELKDMGCLVPMKKEAYYKHKPNLLKNYLLL